MRTDTSIQTSLFPIANQGLFSNNYIEKHLPTSPAWSQHDAKLATIFAGVKDAYRKAAELNLGPGEENQLRETLISPILKLLGFEYAVEPSSQRGGVPNRPDYALFLSHDELVAARQGKSDVRSYYSHAITILEAKYWRRRLNDADSADKLDSRDPTAQLTGYLDDVYRASDGKVQWAILTNGKLWRLFYHHSDFRAGTYYEVDLEEVVRRGDMDDFKRFYLFFSRDAFLPDPQTGKSLLDAHRKGSVEYASAISNRLKELIFDQVFEDLAQGFLEYRRTEKGITAETEKSLAELHDSCMILLYRLIFLLFAESRNLLPVEHPGYHAKSLFRLREDVTHDLTSTPFEKMSSRAYDYWSRFESLCNIIAKGDPSLNVPIYNGGLFEQTPDSFLSAHKLADRFFTRALHALTSDHVTQGSEPSYYDYSSLSVRHLGDVYEGLLEFFVRVADQPMAEVKEKGKVIWTAAAEVAAGAKVVGERKPGEMYIENSNHERKVTGSYFTPPYIVEYIVKHAVGPVLHERIKQAAALLRNLKVLYGRQRHALRVGREWHHWEHPGEPKSKHMPEIQAKEEQLFETLFGIKALDLSMGSGHFLVRTVNAISDTLISFLARFDENPVIARIDQMRQQIITDVERQGVKIDVTRLTEVNLIKRMVMKRCIYGVDLNPMAVELAKLSLWLDSFTLGAPLSFLDHHLKCGNSLIGKDDISEVIIPGSEAAGRFRAAVGSALLISQMADATAEEVHRSRELHGEVLAALTPFKRRLDYELASEFVEYKVKDPGKAKSGVRYRASYAVANAVQKGSVDTILGRGQTDALSDIRLSEETASRYRFFHWRLEFPEVWYDENGEKKNPGFDVGVGNPPYVRMEEFKEMKEHLRTHYEVHGERSDFYAYFIELEHRLLRQGGRFGMIVSNKFLRANYGRPLREFLSKNAAVERVADFAGLPVFPNATVRTIVLLTVRGMKTRAVSYSPPPAPATFRLISSGTLDLSTALRKHEYMVSDNSLAPSGWTFVGRESGGLLARLTGTGTRLVDYCGGQICRGIVSGLTEAFVLSDSETKRILKRNPRAREIVKPFLNGRDIRRYRVDSTGQFLIYTSHGVDISKYPAVEQHLLRFKDRLRQRATKQEWYELQQPQHAYSKLFDAPKIVFPDIATSPRFALDERGHYGSNTTYFIPTSDLYLLALLNSSLAGFYFKSVCAGLEGSGETYLRFFGQYMEGFPVKAVDTGSEADKARHDKMVALVERMLKSHKDLAKAKSQAKKDAIQSEVKATDQQIDALVYELYGLTEDEVRIVEGT